MDTLKSFKHFSLPSKNTMLYPKSKQYARLVQPMCPISSFKVTDPATQLLPRLTHTLYLRRESFCLDAGYIDKKWF